MNSKGAIYFSIFYKTLYYQTIADGHVLNCGGKKIDP